MNTTELLDQVRVGAYIGSNHPEFTTARILKELWNTQNTVFGGVITKPRQGFWRKSIPQTTVAGQAPYTIPTRAYANVLELVELAVDGVTFQKLTPLEPIERAAYETRSGTPTRYLLQGDKLFLYPVPAGAYVLRCTVCLRPSKLHIAQATNNGRITVVDTVNRTIDVAAVPDVYDVVGGTATPIGAGAFIDCVRIGGIHDLSLVNAFATRVGTQFTVAGSIDMKEISVGDVVRSADQTDWPALPEDFHSALADATGVGILMSLGKTMKADALGKKAGADITRFQDLIQPRVKADPKAAKPALSVLRRSGPSFSESR